jgi:predicted amidohydrolase YtcJ
MRSLTLLCLSFTLGAPIAESGIDSGKPDDSPAAADLVLVNAKIWTVNSAQPQAEGVAIWRGRILAVGSNEEVRRAAGRRSRIMDLRGKRVVPGFFDSHLHLLGGGMLLSQVNLKDAKDEAEFGRRLQAFDRSHPRDRWMLGGDWDHDRAFGGRLPSAELIDRYVSDRPVFLRRYDGHMGVVNTRVLKLASITSRRSNPNGGVIDHKANTGEPTGILRDNAMSLVESLIPPPSDAEIAEAVQQALRELAQNGVTSVQDMEGSGADTRRKLSRHYQELARQGKLTARVDLRWPLSEWRELAHIGVEAGLGDDWVKIGGLKGFADGSLGSSTAKMYQPYLNEPNSTGVFVTPLDKMREYITEADKAGLSIAVHAIGDRANAELLDIFAAVEKRNGPRDRRFRIEHAQHLRSQDYPRFRELGVIASMQPYHAIDDGRWAEGRIGPERCASSYAFRSLIDSGARLAFGSDWSVAPLSPLLGIDAAVNRRTLDGKHPGGWFPEQRIRVPEAIEAYTLGAAYAGFEEKDRGSLEVGKLGDLVVLSHDVLDDAQRDAIAEARVLMTVVGGKIVYQTDEMK